MNMSDQTADAECPTQNTPQTPQGDPAEGLQGGPYKQSKSTNESYTNKYLMTSRNPITGTGLNGDGVGGLKPKTAKDRAGNPLTGEGYLESDVNDFQLINNTKNVYLPNSI